MDIWEVKEILPLKSSSLLEFPRHSESGGISSS